MDRILRPILDIRCGHVLDELRQMPNESVNCVVTSPPYFQLRDYQTHPVTFGDGWVGNLGFEPTPQMFIGHLVEIFHEVRRILRKEGVCWINIGDKYAHKPFDHCGIKPKDLMGIPWRVALALQEDGWWIRCDVIWQKGNGLPESVKDRPNRNHEYIFLLTKAEKYWYDADAIREPYATDSVARISRGRGQSGTTKYAGGGPGNQTLVTDLTNACSNPLGRNVRSVWRISTKPFKEAHFATFPPALAERMILAGSPQKVCGKCGKPYHRVILRTGHVNKREHTAHTPGNNPTKTDSTGWAPTKVPTNQFVPVCICGNDAGWTPGTVCDPFSGSGTTLAVALRHGRNAIGIELNPTYAEMARRRAGAEIK